MRAQLEVSSPGARLGVATQVGVAAEDGDLVGFLEYGVVAGLGLPVSGSLTCYEVKPLWSP